MKTLALSLALMSLGSVGQTAKPIVEPNGICRLYPGFDIDISRADCASEKGKWSPVAANKPQPAKPAEKQTNPCTVSPYNCLPIDASHYSLFHVIGTGDLQTVDRTQPLLVRGYAPSVDVDSSTGRVVKLSDEEYARLQKLRQAVADAEKEIAKAYGVKDYIDSADCKLPDTSRTDFEIIHACSTDNWEFRGQFLLVNVP